MNDDLAFLLETAGCILQPFGQAGATLVTAAPPAPARASRPSAAPTADC
jgi:hypothetical protein